MEKSMDQKPAPVLGDGMGGICNVWDSPGTGSLRGPSDAGNHGGVSGIFLYQVPQKAENSETMGDKFPVQRGNGKPKGEDCFEETYLRIIENLEQDQQREREAWQNEQKKDREYYTRWSHQIKTPIAATNLLLSEKNLDVRAVKRELFRIEQYADMALQYQRLEGESSDLVLEKVKLHKMVSQTLKKLSTIFVYKKLHVKLGDLEKEIVTDEKWMCFILEQILTNAAKYTEEGGMIEIWLEQEVLCIRDNGIGIQEEDLPRIFEWGYTGYNGRLDKKSTGIGLSLTKEAAGLLQIGISMESQVGRGTTVFLNLAQKRVCGE